MAQNLNEIREKLDQIDADLIRLLADRFKLVLAVEEAKAGEPIVDLHREQVKIDNAKSLARVYGVDEEFVAALFYLIINASIKRETMARESRKGA